MEKNEKLKQAERILKNINLNEGLVKDNKIPFEYNKNKYRVRMPNTGEEIEANTKATELRLKLLGDDKYMTEKQLIEMYKRKEINIEDLDKKFREKQEEIEINMLKLSKISDENTDALKSLGSIIDKLKDELMVITSEKIKYLQYSIESKVEHFWYVYLTVLITEKLENEKWIKCWKNYEDFEKTETGLTGRAVIRATQLLAGLKVSNSILM